MGSEVYYSWIVRWGEGKNLETQMNTDKCGWTRIEHFKVKMARVIRGEDLSINLRKFTRMNAGEIGQRMSSGLADIPPTCRGVRGIMGDRHQGGSL
jgi:hypothetical protein